MKKLEKKIYDYLKERNWHSPMPANLAKSIMIEGAELLELFQWDNPSIKELKKDKKKLEEVKNELADVLIYTIQMSVLLGFDTDKIVLNKLEQVKKKYPARLMKNRTKNSAKESEYWKIKKKHRGKA